MFTKSKTEDLRNFIAVVDTGSFTAAANLLNTQVANVSRSLSRLERELSITLLTRSTRRIELTEAGSIFLKYAKTGLDEICRGEEALNNLKGTPMGRLRVDCASPFLYHQIIPYVEDFQLAFPDIQLDFITNENIIDLIEKKTDVAIRIGKLADSNLHAKCLGTSKLHIVASPRYLKKCGIPETIDDLKYHRIISFADAPKLNNWYLDSDVCLKHSASASSGEAIRQLTINGNGIALLSNFMVRKDIDSGQLVELLPGVVVSPNPREQVHAVYYKNSAMSARISTFLDFFTRRFKL
jgi:DNA-binding transcriptional LysR family regulator